MNSLDLNNLTKQDTQQLNILYKNYKKKYVLFVDSLAEKYGYNEYVWLLPLFSHNRYWDNTYEQILKFEFAKEKLVANNYGTIYVNDIGLKRAIEKYCKSNNITASIKNDNKIKDSILYSWLRDIYRNIRSLIDVVVRITLAKFFIKKEEYKDLQPVTLLSVPMVYSCIDNGFFDDRNFTNICNYTDIDLVYYPEIIKGDEKWISYYKKLRRINDVRIIVKEHYFGFLDILKYVKLCELINKIKEEQYDFCGDDVTDIIITNIDKKFYSLIETLLYYESTKRMLKNVSVKRLIMWYESRPVDIAVSYAYNKVHDKGNSVAYVSYPLTDFNISLSSYTYKKFRSIPDIFAVSGPLYVSEITENCANQDVIVSPCYRNKYHKVKKNNSKETRLLVCLSYFPNISNNIINIICEYMYDAKENIKIMFKSHPVQNYKSLKAYGIYNIKFDYSFVSGSLMECIKDADIVFMGSSTSSMEIVCSETPLIYYCEKGTLNFSYLPKELENMFCHKVYDYSDFKEVMKEVMHVKQNKNYNIKIEDYFVGITRENTRILLEEAK